MPLIGRIAAATARGYGLFANIVQAAVDPYFNYVVALLHGDGTNGGQNNTFLDSSTNNFTITRNGNTTQGSFSPFSQTGWGNYFDGSGDYLSVADNAALNLGTGNFTIEGWVYIADGIADNAGIVSKRSASAFNSGDYRVSYRTGTSKITFADDTVNERATPVVQKNSWVHFAIVRESGTISAYANGVRGDTAADTVNLGNADVQTIGVNATFFFTGYISNVRIVKGTAVYSGATYTVPTTPLIAITNTSLLTCQANRFLDASSNNFTITRNGDVSVQPFSPFNPITPYSTSAVGGSGYFDGSGDYLSLADNAAFNMGTGNFTAEFWLYTADQTNNYPGIISASVYSDTGAISVRYDNTGHAKKIFIYLAGASPSDPLVTSSAYEFGQWIHVAIVRDSTTALKIYVNGTLDGTGTITSGQVVDFSGANSFYIGRGFDVDGGAAYLAGYISSVRLVKGTAVYTGNFTPPTGPLTAIANTSFLCNFTNGAIFDNAAVADYETVGNAQISTSVKKYGTGSMYFDGSGDYLTTPYSQSINFGTGDFTIEGWFYLNSFANQYYVLGGTWSSATSDEWLIQIENNGSLRFLTTANTSFFATGLIKTGTWYHFAASRNAGVIKAYINGSVFATITNANSIGSVSKTLNIGQQPGGSWPWNGYLDDWRVTKGIGRYPYNFTPPTAEFPNIGGTVTLTADPYFEYTTLLLPGNGTNGAQNNTFLDSSTNAFSITRNGNTTQGTFSPFSQTGWGVYQGAIHNDYASFTTSAGSLFEFTGDFTVEAWVYYTSNAADCSLWVTQGAAFFALNIDSTNYNIYLNSGSPTSSFSHGISLNTWTHVAMVRSGSTVTLYTNGTSRGTITNSSTLGYSSPTLARFGGGAAGSNTRYVSNLRIVKGTAVYTATFTPPTSPLTAISGTSLLTCQSNRFLDASTNALVPTVTGSPSVQAFSPFNPTAAWSAATNGGSGYFDGSGDSLSLADNAAWNMGSGDFTAEAWIYPTSFANEAMIMGQWSGDLGGSGLNWALMLSSGSTGYLRLITSSNGSSVLFDLSTSTFALSLNAWQHIAAVRSGNTYTIYVNGISRATTTNASALFDATNAFTIGSESNTPNQYFTGYISDARVVKGTAVYTAAFTPPTAPLTAISGTSLLANFTNAGIYDATSKNDLETVGNAQISTTQSKFGGSSMYFDGTGDWLQGRNTRLLDIGSGDFTIEGWLYPTTSGTTRAIVAQFNTNGTGPGWTSYLKTTNVIEFYGGSGTITVTGTGTVSANAWSHFAICRYGSTITIYVNGIAGGTGTNSSFSDDTTGPVEVGARGGAGAIPFTGYIDDLRITKGIARYTSNFTPPTTAFLTL